MIALASVNCVHAADTANCNPAAAGGNSAVKAVTASAQTVLGVVGGVLGRKIGSGDPRKREFAVLGTIAGVEVGKAFKNWLTAQEQKCLREATDGALRTGQKQIVQSGNGATMTTEAIDAGRLSRRVNLPVTESVAEGGIPPLDLIMLPYEVSAKKAKLLKAPVTTAAVLADLRRGTIVQVVGKVQDQPWFMVQQDGAATGYAAERDLEATDKPLPESATQSASAIEIAVPANVACRTVKQSVTKNGKTVEDEVTACQTANGWEVVDA